MTAHAASVTPTRVDGSHLPPLRTSVPLLGGLYTAQYVGVGFIYFGLVAILLAQAATVVPWPPRYTSPLAIAAGAVGGLIVALLLGDLASGLVLAGVLGAIMGVLTAAVEAAGDTPGRVGLAEDTSVRAVVLTTELPDTYRLVRRTPRRRSPPSRAAPGC